MKPCLRVVTFALTAALALAGCSGGSAVSPSVGVKSVASGAHAMSVGGLPTIERPFSDFVNSQQGYFYFWIANGPGSSSVMPNCIGASGNYAAGFVDYLGIFNNIIMTDGYPSLGTTYTGTVTQGDNGDSTSTVHVDFDTKNALASASCFNRASFSVIPTHEPLDFGATYQEVEAGTPPALATAHFSLVFTINGTGPAAQIPNFYNTVVPSCPAQAPCMRSIKFTAAATGPLRQPFGVADGTPGTMSIASIGTNHTTGRAGRPGALFGVTAASVIVRQK